MRDSTQRRFFAGLCLLLLWQSGCAAFRPMHGVPARYLPTEMKIGDRSNRRTIDLSLLRQTPPLDPATGSLMHRIDGGDVLGIYIEGFVGKATDPPPVYFPVNNDSPPSFGMPYPVREDGTISLPFVGSINLRGLTLAQAEEKVKQAYLTPKQLIKPDFHRVQVNLQRPRQYRVLVIRQDSRSEPQSNAFLGQLNIGMAKRGTGKVVNLPVYSNDVLNALTATDGLPGLDAENAVYVIRRRGPSTGAGALDPRWPTDLNPELLLRQGMQPEGPVVRGQSPDNSNEFLHGNNVMQARYYGTPNPNVQYANGTNPMPGGQGMSGGSYDPNMSIAPPRIWGDRAIDAPLDYEAAVEQPQYPMMGNGAPQMDPRFNTVDPRFNNTPIRNLPTGGWSPPPQTFGSAEAPNGYEPPIVQTQYPMMGNGPAMGSGPTPLDSRPNAVDPRFNNAPVRNLPGGGWNPQSQPPAGGVAVDAPALRSDIGPNPGMNQPFDTNIPAVPPSGAMPPGSPPPVGMGPPNGPEGAMTPPWLGQPGLPPGAGAIPPGSILDPGHGLVGGGTLDGRHVIRIPIRLGPGETADIRPEDVILYDGDIVFIESRDTEVFYTGGLLGGGQYTLPRDYDLDILQAISLAQSRGVMGASRAVGGVSALNNDVTISPSTAIVLRKLPDGGEVPVKVDLYRARTDLSERIVIQPGDYILLQYTCLEAVAAFFERNLLETALFTLAARPFSNGGGN